MLMTRVNVSYKRTWGLPNFSSASAECGVTIDLTEDEMKDLDATMRNAWRMVKGNVWAALAKDIGTKEAEKHLQKDLGWPSAPAVDAVSGS